MQENNVDLKLTKEDMKVLKVNKKAAKFLKDGTPMKDVFGWGNDVSEEDSVRLLEKIRNQLKIKV